MWKLIAAPIVGAVIGYFTNWIAVKMLFRPRYEKHIGKWKVPFTPGVIPKGQPRLAKAVGEVVENELLTPEVMKEMLLSEETKKRILTSMAEWVNEKKSSETSIHDALLSEMEEESYENFLVYIEENGARYVVNRMLEMNVGKLLTNHILEIAKEKLAESVLGMMIGGSLLDSMAEMLEEKLNQYIEENGREYLEFMIARELATIQEKPMGDIVGAVANNGFDIPSFILAMYEKMVNEHIDRLLEAFQLSSVVENRINSMPVEEVERLVLVIMKKELGAIVDLGALIGFVLGLVNVLILCI